MKARLLCKYGELKGAEFDIADEATIGRSESNSIVLDSPSVSGEHARIARDESGDYVIEDLGSRNGTRLDGRTLRGREVLDRLHVVNFGHSSDFVFVRLEDAPPADNADAGGSTVVDAEPPPLPEALGTPPVAGADQPAAPEDGAGRTQIDNDAPQLPPALRDDRGGE